MMLLSSVSGQGILAQSAKAAPTNSADVSAIASAYVESGVSSKLDTTAQVVTSFESATTSVFDVPYTFVNRINGLGLSAQIVDLAEHAQFASSAEICWDWKHASGKQDVLTFAYDADSAISSINGSALAGGGGGVDSATVSAIASSYAESAASGKLDSTAFNSGDFYTTANESGFVDSAYVDSTVSGKQDSLTFAYDADSAISSINGSALAGGGGGGADYSAGKYISIADNVISTTGLVPFNGSGGSLTLTAYKTAGLFLGNDILSAVDGWNGWSIEGFHHGHPEYNFGINRYWAYGGNTASTASHWVISNDAVSATWGTAVKWRLGSAEYNYWNAKLDSSSIECDENSAITAIGGSAIGGGGGGGVDSATCSAIASAYAESAASGKLDTTAFNSGDFYSTANESGYVGSAYVDSAVSGKQDSLTFAWDSANAISSINGSALAGPESFSEQQLTFLKQALGVDETVLWTGAVGSTGSTKDLSEDTRNFEKIRIYTQVSTGTTERCVQIFDIELKFSSTQALAFVHVDNISGGNLLSEIIYLCFQANANTFNLLAGCKWSNGTFSQNISSYDFNIVKVVGIHRIAGN